MTLWFIIQFHDSELSRNVYIIIINEIIKYYIVQIK